MGIKTIIWLEHGLKDCRWKASDLAAQFADGPVAANALQTLSLSQVWAFYDQTMLDVRIGFSDEPKNLESEWRQLVQVGTFTSSHWNDAYLAAFALAADFELITIDKGFSQFKNLRCTILSGQ